MSILVQRTARAIRRAIGLDRERRWNRQYAQGGWEWLTALDELAHHAVLAAYFTRLKPNGRVLDVGCGNGMFLERLTGKPYSRYVGIDFEEPVKQAAQGRADEKTFFYAADMNDYVPDGQFDAIVFDESIYYLWDLAQGLARYEQYLAPDGVFLVSMHGKETNIPRWEVIDGLYQVLDAVTIENRKGVKWTVKALARPQGPGGSGAA